MLDRRLFLAGCGSLALMPHRAIGAEPDARTLRAAPIEKQVAPPPARMTALLGLEGQTPGPVLRGQRGTDLSIKVANGLTEPLSLHWHGVRGQSAADGVAGLSAPPCPAGGETSIVQSLPDAGLYLYRPMVIGRSAELSARGLKGALVVDGAIGVMADTELVCVVDDVKLTTEGALAPFDAADVAGAGRLGTVMCVNGLPAPLARSFAPGARIHLRLANLCNARLMRIRFDDMKAWVIGVDGQPTDTFEPLRASLPFAPGSRYDVLAEVPSAGTGRVTAMIGTGLPLVTLTADPDAQARRTDLPPITAPPLNPLLPPEIKLQRALRPQMVLTGGLDPQKPDGPALPWTVNGKPGTLDGKPLFKAKRGTAVVLALVNRTAWPQPIHLHGHVSRLLHPLDDGWEPYWLDTVTVAPGQTTHVAFIADNPGRWLIGGTVLERLDAGLFAWFEVS